MYKNPVSIYTHIRGDPHGGVDFHNGVNHRDDEDARFVPGSGFAGAGVFERIAPGTYALTAAAAAAVKETTQRSKKREKVRQRLGRWGLGFSTRRACVFVLSRFVSDCLSHAD